MTSDRFPPLTNKNSSVFVGLGLCLAALLYLSTNWLTQRTQERYPYEHIFRVTATLEFDGEKIPLDSLFGCHSDYEGPATRAVQLPFDISRGYVAIETETGGMVFVSISKNLCGAFSELWAGIDTGFEVPAAWTPLIRWYDHRDPLKVVYGETYWSETALKNPDGRLKVIEGFQVSYPEQATSKQWNALINTIQQQMVQFGLWRTDRDPPVRLTMRPRAKPLPMYLRIPRSVWSKPPDYVRPKSIESNWEELRDYLDRQPQGDGLMFLGEKIQVDLPPAGKSAIFDLKTGIWGNAPVIGYFGIPQRDEERWGLLLNERSWQRMQVEKERISFYDGWIPLDHQDDVLVLRTDTPGMSYHFRHYGDWYRDTERKVEFLGKPFVNGPYDLPKSHYIFDLETRDLWINTESAL